MIESSLPSHWRELQENVARIFSECGFEAETEKNIQTVRGNVSVDVYAEDNAHRPKAIYICECKHWNKSVPQNVVHSFRTVVSDIGAHFGMIISSKGFQSGTFKAAGNSNVFLYTYEEFQSQYLERWWENYVVPKLREISEPLVDYTEPINTRVFREADKLNEISSKKFIELRKIYMDITFIALPFYLHPSSHPFLFPTGTIYPSLPIKDSFTEASRKSFINLPDEILDATSLREFISVLCKHIIHGIQLFDELFGRRV